ncbi:polysaccharide biosynthesis C-terminal domain-containing protein [Thermotoga sp. SG1]|uniref:polysaccharide biosynthesis C-terminal domain-containing protein n=1 Tax=Thermotoga sp. SG1 TaxID=126739 RepID=UPI001E5E5AED|nr:polysaccharide biosynthesis C-terminal domain-containing protein [Thermotoga sp. SG1]
MISETTVLGINFTKKTYWHIVVTGVSAIANFVGNQLLVPYFGAKGAAISTGLSYVLFFTLRTLIAEKLYPIGFNLKKIYTGVLLISTVAFFGTFSKGYLPVVLSFVGILFVLFLYRKELAIVKDLVSKIRR